MERVNHFIRKLTQIGDMIKFSHSVFALPFALAAMIVAARGLPSFRTILLILCAMITARNAGMAFNRYLDAEIDARNPRTQGRHIPQGVFSRQFVLGFSFVNAVLFVLVCSRINTLAFLLSFPTLGLLSLYSATKRWTHWSHLVLGLVLGISPVGAWIAVQGNVSAASVILSLGVILWVAGFDILYATQDHDFDRKEGLHSLVVHLGITRALNLSRIFHAGCMLFLAAFGWSAHLGGPFLVTLAVIAGLFAYEHSLVKPHDLSKINAAFFNINGLISLLFLAGVAISLWYQAAASAP